VFYFSMLWPELSSAPGAALPFLAPELMPVVVPDFALLVFVLSDFILGVPGSALPSLDVPFVGCVCADAIAVAPNNEATTRAEIASLERMRNLLLWICDARVKTCDADLGSRTGGCFLAMPAGGKLQLDGTAGYTGFARPPPQAADRYQAQP
jgi:hypothetical protein